MSDRMHTIRMPDSTSSQLLAAALDRLLKHEEPKVQILVERGRGVSTINALRVALSRSRGRNKTRGRKIAHFTLNHSIYAYTDKDGARYDALVLSIQKKRLHRALELVDDMLDRGQLQGGTPNVA